MVRKGSLVIDFGTFSVAEKSHFLDCLLIPHLAVDGELAVPPYFFDGSPHRAMSLIVDDSGIDWASFVKRAYLQLWSRTNGIPVRKQCYDLHLVGTQ